MAPTTHLLIFSHPGCFQSKQHKPVFIIWEAPMQTRFIASHQIESQQSIQVMALTGTRFQLSAMHNMNYISDNAQFPIIAYKGWCELLTYVREFVTRYSKQLLCFFYYCANRFTIICNMQQTKHLHNPQLCQILWSLILPCGNLSVVVMSLDGNKKCHARGGWQRRILLVP